MAHCQSLTPVSLLVNEFDFRSVLHGQVSLAAANQILVIHEARNGCKKLDSLKDCFENVNTVKTLYNVTRYNRIFNIRHKIVGNRSVSIKIPSL